MYKNNMWVTNRGNQGKIVETKTGIIGRTFNDDDLINGKVKVYTDKGNLLCDPSTLIFKGFIEYNIF